MNESIVKIARIRAKNFIHRVDQLIAERGEKGALLDWNRGTRRSGQARRASQELSDALADMRKPAFKAQKVKK